MTAPDPGTRLRTLLQRVPDNPPPLDAVVAAGERARRARRARLAGAGAAAAVLVVALASLVVGGPGEPTPPDVARSPDAAGTPTSSAPALSLAGRWRVLRIPPSGRSPGYDVTTTSWTGVVRMQFDRRGGRGLTGARPGDGSFLGRTGCNYTGGVYVQDGPDVAARRSTVGTSLAGCPGEPDLYSVFTRMRGVDAVGADGRLLLDADGDVLAELEPMG